jgi:hypothetical protein
MQSAQILLRSIDRTGAEQSRLLKNGAAAHELTREDRAKGGRTRAEKIRRRKELRERFEVSQLEDLAGAELELLDQALVRGAATWRPRWLRRARSSRCGSSATPLAA